MDDKSKIGKSDDSRININESYEVQYWCEKMNVSKDELKEAIQAAGSKVDDVSKYLKEKS